MSPKFSRFLHLERSRGEGPKPEAPSKLQSSNRFETLAQRGEMPQEAAVPDAHLERFRGEAPLALAEAPSEEEHFPRCARCESDNGRFAQACSMCGADLTTPQQRAYNEQLRQTRQQDRAREREAVAALSQQRLEEERRKDDARYSKMMERLREEERGGSSWGWDFLTGDTPFGWKLLSLISNPVVRTAVVILCILIPVALWRYGVGRTRTVGALVLFFFILSLIPSRRRRWWF